MEHLLILFFATFAAAFTASAFPGLLNMNAAKTSVEKGKTNGVIFGFGVATMVMLQAYIAVLISKFLDKNAEVVDILLKIALAVFAFFAIYFFFAARKGRHNAIKKVKTSKKNSFFKGALLAALNVLTIPFYSGLNIMWKASGWIKFEVSDIVTFIFGAGSGTFAIMYMYAIYFNKLEKKNNSFSSNANYIMCALMGVLFMITFFRLYFK